LFLKTEMINAILARYKAAHLLHHVEAKLFTAVTPFTQKIHPLTLE